MKISEIIQHHSKLKLKEFSNYHIYFSFSKLEETYNVYSLEHEGAVFVSSANNNYLNIVGNSKHNSLDFLEVRFALLKKSFLISTANLKINFSNCRLINYPEFEFHSNSLFLNKKRVGYFMDLARQPNSLLIYSTNPVADEEIDKLKSVGFKVDRMAPAKAKRTY